MTFTENNALDSAKVIAQQPQLWQETYVLFLENKLSLENFFLRLITEHVDLKVIFTGTDSTTWIGDMICSHFLEQSLVLVDHIKATDMMANPDRFLQNVPTLLVSFSESGDDSKHVVAMNLAHQSIDHIYHLIFTCNPVGALVKQSTDSSRFIFQLPRAVCSFDTSMMFAALLTFDWLLNQNMMTASEVEAFCLAAEDFLQIEKVAITRLADRSFDRVVYLGAGPLEVLAHASALEMLQLTDGQVTTIASSPLAFSHGVKAFVNDRTIIVVFISSIPYTRQYDPPLLKEIASVGMRQHLVVTCDQDHHLLTQHGHLFFKVPTMAVTEPYINLFYTMISQTLTIDKSNSLGIGSTDDLVKTE